ncbi:MAG: efflux RND transporter periplasmic adaptor subunit [Bacteroidales bacterium]|nr:efflux RND transporter periplasmic adaptor subunit [Bacteroidales bacterium]
MKIYHILLLLTVFLFACNSKNDRSDAYGNFEATEITVSSEANGKILEFNINEGQKIDKGFYVGVIDTIDLVLKKEQLINMQKAVASKTLDLSAQIDVFLQQKKNTLINKNRLEKLFNDGAATQKQLDDVKGAIDLIDKKIKSVKVKTKSINDEIAALDKQIAQIEQAIKKCYIKNPVSGTVLTKYVNTGEIAMFGKPLYKIADLNEVKLKVYISGDQLPKIKLGQEVEVIIDKDKKSNRKLKGKVSWIASSAEFTPKTIQTKKERVNQVYAVKVIVKNDGSLKIGMPGEVSFK